MKQFDKELKERAKNEPFPLLEDYAGRVFRTCAALEETTMETSKNSAPHKKHTKRWMAWAAAAVAAFIAVPNISPTAAAAMSDVPVLGALVEIVTFREYTYDDGHSSADVSVPELSGGVAGNQVNKECRPIQTASSPSSSRTARRRAKDIWGWMYPAKW